MTTVERIAYLRQAGVELSANAGRLHYRAPAGALTPELRAVLTRHKSALLAALSGDPDADALPPDDLPPARCPDCAETKHYRGALPGWAWTCGRCMPPVIEHPALAGDATGA
jgi:hypothetical protein